MYYMKMSIYCECVIMNIFIVCEKLGTLMNVRYFDIKYLLEMPRNVQYKHYMIFSDIYIYIYNYFPKIYSIQQ